MKQATTTSSLLPQSPGKSGVADQESTPMTVRGADGRVHLVDDLIPRDRKPVEPDEAIVPLIPRRNPD